MELNLTSPSTLIEAWVLVPALVVAASAALGWLLGRATGTPLGALTVPAGFLAGVAVTTALLSAGLSGRLSVAVIAALAVAGALVAALDVRRLGRLPRPGAAVLWPAAAALLAYGLAMAPLAGSGRSGMLGYTMYDDPAVHITLVEHIAQNDAREHHVQRDSFYAVTHDLKLGYPLGSYAWPLFARVATGVDVFHLWTPLGAVVLALMALVAYSILRGLTMPRAFAAAGGALVGVGYLVYSYHAQGATKEVLMPVAVYGAIALAAQALARPPSRWSLVPATVATAAAIANLGYGGLAWVGPAALLIGAVLGWRAWRARSRAPLQPLVGAGGLALLLGVPAVIRTIDFFSYSNPTISNESRIANLFGPVPFKEAFNVWLAHDYRVSMPHMVTSTDVGVWLAIVLCVVGAVWALRHRAIAIPIAILSGVAAILVVSPRSSAYYDAKTYVALAPALGLATVAGVFALARRRGVVRLAALAAGALLAVGVVASDAFVYGGVWVTPRFRFEELERHAERTRGQGPVLVNDFEEWAPYLLRESRPWHESGFRWPYRRLRTPTGAPRPRLIDTDDYTLQHIQTFPFILQRKSPETSRPPSNFVPDLETKRYQLWRRAGTGPYAHLPFGSDGFLGPAELECRKGVPLDHAARKVIAASRALGRPVRAAVGPAAPIIAVSPPSWTNFRPVALFKRPEHYAAIGGAGSGYVEVPPGRYYAWIQGSMGPGVVLYERPVSQPNFIRLGYATNDMGISAHWQPIGPADLHRRTVVHVSAARRRWWKASSRHPNIFGNVVFTRAGARARIVDVPASRASSLCGRRLDWLEVPPA